MHTSLAQLHDAGACAPRYKHLCKELGGVAQYGRKTPLPYSRILETNGLEDCLWALFHGDEKAVWVGRLACLAFAQHVEHLAKDSRVTDCNKTVHLYLHGEAAADDAAARWAAAAADARWAAAAADARWAAAAADARWAAAAARWADDDDDDERKAQVEILQALLRQMETDDSIAVPTNLASTPNTSDDEVPF